MGLLEDQIEAIEKDIAHFRAGKLKLEDADMLMKMYSQTEKRTKQMLQSMKLKKEFGQFPTKLIDYVVEYEVIPMCPLKKHSITREQCLDLSGSNKYKTCKTCDIGEETKRLILGDKNE